LLRKTYLGNGVFLVVKELIAHNFGRACRMLRETVLEVLDTSLEMVIKLDFGMISG
jgi:hypothetical protein